MNDTFNAASSALFDAGMTIVMSDRAGGLLTARRVKSNRSARIWISPWIEDVDYTTTIQIREDGPSRTTARIRIAINGEARIDKKAIDQIWTLMSRQVLMKTPPSIDSSGTGS